MVLRNLVNIDSGNGVLPHCTNDLLPDGTNELTLTYNQRCYVVIIWEQLHKKLLINLMR